MNARHRLLIVLAAGALFALSVVLATTSLAKPGQGNKLTPQQRAEFVAGAKEVAGLNDAQIAAALKNPDAIDAIPVSVGVDEVSGPATASSAEGRRATAAACANVRGEANYRNIRGNRWRTSPSTGSSATTAPR